MKKKSGFHWGLLCSALLYMLVGFFLLKWPDRAIQIVCYAFGTITLVYGMTRLIRYALKKNQEQGILSGLNLTIGIIMTGIGSFLLVSPSTVVSIIPIVIGIVIVIHSLTKIQQALEIKAVQYDKWWIMLIVSLVTAVLGIIIVFKPFSTAALMVKVIGIILIADGLMSTASVFFTSRTVKKYGKVLEAEYTEFDSDGKTEKEAVHADVVDVEGNKLD